MANTKIYIEQGGEQMVIGAGATLTIEGDLEVAGGGAITPGADSITTAMIQDDAVTSDKIPDDEINTLLLADEAVTFEKTLAFISAEQTGTGMEQSIAHGLGVVPAAVIIVPSSNDGLMDAEFTITQGVHTMANILVTATTGLKYYAMAWG